MKGEVDQLHKKKSIRQRQWNSYDDGAAPPVGVWWTTTFLRFFSKSHVKIKNTLIPSKNLKKEHFLIE